MVLRQRAFSTSGKGFTHVQGGPERSWSTKGGFGPRGPHGPHRSALNYTFENFTKNVDQGGPGSTRVGHEDQNPPWWTRRAVDIFLMQGPKEDHARPFGIGLDGGIAPKERKKRLTQHRKKTPYLRRVSVEFEVKKDGSWQRSDGDADRIGFATYKSAPKPAI
ncbi:hypothetical protein B9Z19DRAFT_1134033 [Tuber borchii]|uniref:Uncharacterized protein n=1 Tax=Tuber borchii TaxID=42251 RepID=A0A2T6ZEU4_TUBBO|nr:hypothetical protein B9Z19DRAFT_1134033 [Tuber borchii]